MRDACLWRGRALRADPNVSWYETIKSHPLKIKLHTNLTETITGKENNFSFFFIICNPSITHSGV